MARTAGYIHAGAPDLDFDLVLVLDLDLDPILILAAARWPKAKGLTSRPSSTRPYS
ncbi:hypothetical protein B0A48_09966 [Cryoendolithus antarcticus]|uniref:Uncharacterized protein n=1 Tax=Cryoendolithus antarcticus TaxID=1507870 RepID=A0A1V8T3N4_9PEZI|nr:hypothetical protein B0A48_09966 [Cryoendolithus antarcticus]